MSLASNKKPTIKEIRFTKSREDLELDISDDNYLNKSGRVVGKYFIWRSLLQREIYNQNYIYVKKDLATVN